VLQDHRFGKMGARRAAGNRAGHPEQDQRDHAGAALAAGSEGGLLRRELTAGGRALASTGYTVDDRRETTKASLLFFTRR